MTPTSVTLNMEKNDNSPVIKILVHYLMDSFSLHTLVQLLYNLYLQDVEIQTELNDPINLIRLSISRNNDCINLDTWFLACSSLSPVPNTM